MVKPFQSLVQLYRLPQKKATLDISVKPRIIGTVVAGNSRLKWDMLSESLSHIVPQDKQKRSQLLEIKAVE